MRIVFETYPQLGSDVQVDKVAVSKEVQDWLDGKIPALVLTGGSVKLIELPENF